MRVLVSVCVKASPLFVVFLKTQAQTEYKKINHFYPDTNVFKNYGFLEPGLRAFRSIIPDRSYPGVVIFKD